VQGLATKLRDAGHKPKVQTVSPHTLAADFTAALEQAPLVLLAVSAPLQDALAALLAEERPEASAVERWLVMQLDDGEIEGLPAAVEVIAWPRQGRGRGALQRQQALARIRELVANCAGGAAPAKPSQAKTAGRQAADFERRTKETLAKRVGYRCSREGCGRPTMGPNAADPAGSQCIGEAAHIEAAAPGGKRYNPEMSDQQRKSIANGIWLCEPCHTIIDGDEINYTVAVLKKWKRTAEDNAYLQLLGNPQRSSESLSTLSGQPALDFSSYRPERGQGFHGRQWLFENVQQWALAPNGSRALLITADFGVGKTAFLSALIDAPRAGIPPVLAQHFCRTGFVDTLSVGRFVTSLAEQLAEALPGYRALLADANDEQANERRQKLREASKEPKAAFEHAVLDPLNNIPPPSESQLLVVDALEEALDPRGASLAQDRGLTIVQLLADYASRLPHWLKVLATSRNRRDVVDCLRGGFFGLEVIDAEAQSNQDDIHAYVKDRCAHPPLAQILETVGLEADELAAGITAKCGGKFLYAVNLLKEILLGNRTISTSKDLAALPQGMDDFYRQAFECRFPDRSDYSPVMPLLALLSVQEEPLGFRELAAILKVSEEAISLWIEPLEDLLRLQFSPEQNSVSCTEDDWLISFDHISLQQWLTERSGGPFRRPRAGRFGVDRKVAAAQVRTWALAEVAANRAHTSPYLVRHLASHLRDDERVEVIAGQLRQFPWLQARLKVAGLNALLGDFRLELYEPHSLPPELSQLERALRQAAHVLNHEVDFLGYEQLASQLLTRLPRGISLDLDSLLKKAGEQLTRSSLPRPMVASLFTSNIETTLELNASLSCPLARTSNGNLMLSLSSNEAVVWDPLQNQKIYSLTNHLNSITGILELGNDESAFITCSDDGTIKHCRPGHDSVTYQDHKERIRGIMSLDKARFLSFTDKTLLLWEYDADRISIVQEIHFRARRITPINSRCFALIEAVTNTVHLAEISKTGQFSLKPVEFKAETIIFLPSTNALLMRHNDNKEVWIFDLLSNGDPRPFISESSGSLKLIKTFFNLPNGDIAGLSAESKLLLWKEGCIETLPTVFRIPNQIHGFISISDHLIAVLDMNNIVRTINLRVGDKHSTHASSLVSALEFLEDGSVVSLQANGTISIFDIRAGSLSVITTLQTELIDSRSDLVKLVGASFATTCTDSKIRTWTVKNNKLSLLQELDFICTDDSSSYWDRPIYLAMLGKSHLFAADRANIVSWSSSSTNSQTELSFYPGKREKRDVDISALTIILKQESTEDLKPLVLALERPKPDGGWYNYYLLSETVCEGGKYYPTFEPQRAITQISDGSIVCSGSDFNLYVWNEGDSEIVICLKGHKRVIRDVVSFNNAFLSCSDDRTIRMWKKNKLLNHFEPIVIFVADSSVTSIACDSGSGFIVSGDWDGNIHIFQSSFTET
jgi:WD40 repeat protein